MHDDITDHLRRKILSGGFDKMTFLPPERKLAEEYQVGRGIIRAILRTLCEEGILYNVPRQGFRMKKAAPRRLKRIILRLPIPISADAYEVFGILSGICCCANELFTEVLISMPPAKLDLKELRERFNADDIQGIIFLEQNSDILSDPLEKSGIPFVIANLEDDLEVPCVRMDYREAGRQAGRRLLQAGYSRPLIYSGPSGVFIYREILAGFRGAFSEENRKLEEDMILSSDKRVLPKKITRLLSLPKPQRPDSVFCIRDYRAALVYQQCRKLSLRIPEDIGIISYDNITWPDAERCGLTSVAEDVGQIGRQSVLLLEKMFKSECGAATCVIPAQLVERASLRKPDRSRTIIRPAL